MEEPMTSAEWVEKLAEELEPITPADVGSGRPEGCDASEAVREIRSARST